MPTYDFRCPKCSHHFEVALPFGSKTRPLCPQCRHAKTEKLISPPAIHFKGTGFFKTDSQKKINSATSLPSKRERPTEGPPRGSEGVEKKETKSKESDPSNKKATSPTPTSEGKKPPAAEKH